MTSSSDRAATPRIARLTVGVLAIAITAGCSGGGSAAPPASGKTASTTRLARIRRARLRSRWRSTPARC